MSIKALRGVRPEALRRLYVKAEEAGCTVSLTEGGHVKVAGPEGGLTFGPLTASGGRATANVRSQIRRLGVAL